MWVFRSKGKQGPSTPEANAASAEPDHPNAGQDAQENLQEPSAHGPVHCKDDTAGVNMSQLQSPDRSVSSKALGSADSPPTVTNGDTGTRDLNITRRPFSRPTSPGVGAVSQILPGAPGGTGAHSRRLEPQTQLPHAYSLDNRAVAQSQRSMSSFSSWQVTPRSPNESVASGAHVRQEMEGLEIKMAKQFARLQDQSAKLVQEEVRPLETNESAAAAFTSSCSGDLQLATRPRAIPVSSGAGQDQLLALMRRELDLLEQKLTRQFSRLEDQSTRLVEAHVKAMEAKFANFEAQGLSLQFSELNGAVKALQEELEQQCKRGDAAEARSRRWRQLIESEVRANHTDLKREVAEFASSRRSGRRDLSLPSSAGQRLAVDTAELNPSVTRKELAEVADSLRQDLQRLAADTEAGVHPAARSSAGVPTEMSNDTVFATLVDRREAMEAREHDYASRQDVERIVDERLSQHDYASRQDVERIVGERHSQHDYASRQDVERIVDERLSAFQESLMLMKAASSASASGSAKPIVVVESKRSLSRDEVDRAPELPAQAADANHDVNGTIRRLEEHNTDLTSKLTQLLEEANFGRQRSETMAVALETADMRLDSVEDRCRHLGEEVGRLSSSLEAVRRAADKFANRVATIEGELHADGSSVSNDRRSTSSIDTRTPSFAPVTEEASASQSSVRHAAILRRQTSDPAGSADELAARVNKVRFSGGHGVEGMEEAPQSQQIAATTSCVGTDLGNTSYSEELVEELRKQLTAVWKAVEELTSIVDASGAGFMAALTKGDIGSLDVAQCSSNLLSISKEGLDNSVGISAGANQSELATVVADLHQLRSDTMQLRSATVVASEDISALEAKVEKQHNDVFEIKQALASFSQSSRGTSVGHDPVEVDSKLAEVSRNMASKVAALELKVSNVERENLRNQADLRQSMSQMQKHSRKFEDEFQQELCNLTNTLAHDKSVAKRHVDEVAEDLRGQVHKLEERVGSQSHMHAPSTGPPDEPQLQSSMSKLAADLAEVSGEIPRLRYSVEDLSDEVHALGVRVSNCERAQTVAVGIQGNGVTPSEGNNAPGSIPADAEHVQQRPTQEALQSPVPPNLTKYPGELRLPNLEEMAIKMSAEQGVAEQREPRHVASDPSV